MKPTTHQKLKNGAGGNLNEKRLKKNKEYQRNPKSPKSESSSTSLIRSMSPKSRSLNWNPENGRYLSRSHNGVRWWRKRKKSPLDKSPEDALQGHQKSLSKSLYVICLVIVCPIRSYMLALNLTLIFDLIWLYFFLSLSIIVSLDNIMMHLRIDFW